MLTRASVEGDAIFFDGSKTTVPARSETARGRVQFLSLFCSVSREIQLRLSADQKDWHGGNTTAADVRNDLLGIIYPP